MKEPGLDGRHRDKRWSAPSPKQIGRRISFELLGHLWLPKKKPPSGRLWTQDGGNVISAGFQYGTRMR